MYLEDRESALLDRAQNGDLQSFLELVNPHLSELLKTLQQFSTSEFDFESLLIGVLADAYSNISLYKTKIKFRQWLYRKLFRAARDLEWETNGSFDFHIYVGSSHSTFRINSQQRDLHRPDPESKCSLEKRAIEAMHTLPWHERVAIVLCDYTGFDYSSIAYITESSIAEVGANIFHAREHLLHKLRIDT